MSVRGVRGDGLSGEIIFSGCVRVTQLDTVTDDTTISVYLLGAALHTKSAMTDEN